MKNPYQVLGVEQTATAEEIKQAYRALARELHPDLNPGNARAEDRFKDISAAYDFLSDATKRAQYDAGEIDATGAAKRPRWRARPEGAHTHRAGFNWSNDPDDILSELLRRKEKGRAQWGGGGSRAGQDTRHALTVSFVEAAVGATKRVTLVTGKSLDVRIPGGASDGQSLRLKGQGHPGINGGPAGDTFIDIHVESHPFLTRHEFDVLAEIPISLPEAVLGGKVTVPTVDGRVSLTVPPGSNTGTVLRLKGKGIASAQGRGDQLVTLKVVLPDDDAELKKFVEKWGPRNGYDPRAKLGM